MSNNELPSLTALVEYQVRSNVYSTDEWLDVWGVRGQDALVGEPETTAYEAVVSMDDPSQVLVFERYAKGKPSIEIHSARPAHADLLSVMGERNMTKRRVMSNLFADIEGYGWWSRPEQADVQSTAGLAVTIIGSRFSSSQMRDDYVAITGEHAEYCRQNEPGTLIYSGGIAQRDADRGPDIKRGDLLFVAVFADDAAAILHRDDPQHLALQPKLKSLGHERMFMQTYQTSGMGFLWCQAETP